MSWTAEKFSGNVVIVGDFNPAVFSPAWLERNQLIGEADARTAVEDDDLVVSRRATQIKTDAFTLQVMPGKLIVQSEPLTPVVRDLAVGSLLLLSHTPVRALGLNYMAHYKLRSCRERTSHTSLPFATLSGSAPQKRAMSWKR
ncbi:MAG TPA: hypothetical protein VHP37_17575 [Burkholderiales bacterium]|nr:hypothetical protein [Burkholderiales bacterium]